MRVLQNTSVLLVAALLLTACGLWTERDWHQKITVEVETPQGVVTGSSVQRVDYSRANFDVPAGSDHSFRTKGEAVVVDLGPAGKLFALLKGETHVGDAGKLATIAFYGVRNRGSREAVSTVLRQPDGSTAELPSSAYPLLVTFTDINDPASIKQVDPDNLAASFGPGLELKRITVTKTDEAVTRGSVESTLGWIYSATFLIPPEQRPRFIKDLTIEQKLMPADFVDLQTWAEAHKKAK